MFKNSKSKHLNFLKIYSQAGKLVNKIPTVKKRKKSRYIFKSIKYLSLIILLLFFLLFLILAINFFNIKLIYQEVILGKNNAEQAIFLINEKNYREAQDFSKVAENNFSSAFRSLEKYQNNLFVTQIPYFNEQYNEISYLLATGETICKALESTSGLIDEIVSVLDKVNNFSELSSADKRIILKNIYQSTPEINGIKANFELALININKIKFRGLLFPVKDEVKELETQIVKVSEMLNKAIPMFQLIPSIFGYPNEATYLVLLQNSDELRPTGGFIGTYGILSSKDGDILRYDTHDIYHMDMPVKDKINEKPPEPLEKYLGINKWYMRDANWSPNWPTAANRIAWFYEKENKLLPPKDQINNYDKQFNGIIGLMPEFITDLIDLVGPIYIDKEEYNKDNFVNLLEYKVEKGYVQLGIPSWHRKEVIGDIVKEIKNKIFNQPISELLSTIDIVNKNLEKKNVVINFNDKQLQSLIEEEGWAGKIIDTEGDYVFAVDANMASLKTDAVISRRMAYKIKQSTNGIFADLNISYSHNGDFDWRTTRYRTYTRVYVPLGSQLISVDGISDGEVEVHNELGKTVFAGFISIEPGEIGNLSFNYKLPDEINNMLKYGQYSLYVQKQPGKDVNNLSVDLSLLNNIKSYNPTGFYVDKNNSSISWNTDAEVDREFYINTTK